MILKKLKDEGVDSVEEKEEELRGGSVALFDPHIGQKGKYGVAISGLKRSAGVNIHVNNDADEVGRELPLVQERVPQFCAVHPVVRLL